MHLIIPFAASHALTGPEVWVGLQLPQLQALLRRLKRQHVLQETAATALHLPHERLQAQALGWSLEAATLPWAAWHQAQQGGHSPTQVPGCLAFVMAPSMGEAGKVQFTVSRVMSQWSPCLTISSVLWLLPLKLSDS